MAGDVLILGCGPAGLLAAYAVEQLGGEPDIVSFKRKSVFQGAQYLHVPISGLTNGPDGHIRTYKRGTKEGYAKKVYGDPDAPCSWDLQPADRQAWDLRAVYDKLWDRYESRIIDRSLDARSMGEIGEDPRWRLVISTLPIIQLCYRRAANKRHAEISDGQLHHFEWESMWTIDYAPPEVHDNTVLYSGDPTNSWYRASRVFGHAATEWSDLSPPLGGAYLTPEEEKPAKIYRPKKGIKVVGTNCDCFPHVKRVGRFGTWRKGYLSHMAYHDAANMYEEATA